MQLAVCDSLPHTSWQVQGKPTGAVRVSFGYTSSFEDACAVLAFLQEFFLSDEASTAAPVPSSKQLAHQQPAAELLASPALSLLAAQKQASAQPAASVTPAMPSGAAERLLVEQPSADQASVEQPAAEQASAQQPAGASLPVSSATQSPVDAPQLQAVMSDDAVPAASAAAPPAADSTRISPQQQPEPASAEADAGHLQPRSLTVSCQRASSTAVPESAASAAPRQEQHRSQATQTDKQQQRPAPQPAVPDAAAGTHAAYTAEQHVSEVSRPAEQQQPAPLPAVLAAAAGPVLLPMQVQPAPLPAVPDAAAEAELDQLQVSLQDSLERLASLEAQTPALSAATSPAPSQAESSLQVSLEPFVHDYTELSPPGSSPPGSGSGRDSALPWEGLPEAAQQVRHPAPCLQQQINVAAKVAAAQHCA